MKIIVTGGSSMVGKHLQKILPDAIYLNSKDADLTDANQTKNIFNKIKPTVVIHLAAKVGGIMDNIKNPVNFFEENVFINTNVLKTSHENNVNKFIAILSTCVYPDKLSDFEYPITEDKLHNGPPTPTNFAYGYAKRCLAVQIDAYNQQYNTKYSYLIPCNLYSEYDHFTGDKAHFLSSLINKIIIAKKNNQKTINLFGSGKPLRQFMYAEDLAKAIKISIDEQEPFKYNISTSENKSILEIAEIALKACDAEYMALDFDRSKPDGQFRKDASSKKFLDKHPYFQYTSLFEGVKKIYNIKYNE